MAIYLWKGDYFYGGKSGKEIFLKTRIREIGKMHNMIQNEVTKWTTRDPEGNPVVYYHKQIKGEELDDVATPRNYPGYYYWVWYNGVFFEVRGETEKYVLVNVQEGNYRQADALGIPSEKVYGKYYDGAEVGMWWVKKKDIKMPDEFGKGKCIYLDAGYYRDDVYKVIWSNGNKIRVQGWEDYWRLGYERLRDKIKKNEFPWAYKYKKWNAGSDPEIRVKKGVIYYEATFDLRHLREYRAKIKDERYGEHYLDFYWYGMEKAPYRL